MTHQNIPMTPVESSQILCRGYDAETKRIAVHFKKKDGSQGAVYHYDGVPQSAWEEWCSAESVGSHFYKHIKPNYPFTRIPDDQIEAVSDGAQ